MNLYHDFCRNPWKRIFLAADGSPTGGGDGTLKQKLETAEKSLADANGKLQGAEKERDQIKGQLEAAEKERDGLKTQVQTLTTDLGQARSEVAKLKGEAKTATERASEIGAAAGVPPAPKATEAAAAANGNDGKALFEQYEKLMQSDAAAATAFWGKHQQALTDFANSPAAKAGH